MDFYLFNYHPDWILGKLEFDYFGQTVPNPNIIIFSGQGIVLIWLLEPVPHQALPLWQAVQNHFLKELSSLGGDSKTADPTRIFRVAGSINSKNGAQVTAQYRHDTRYVLKTLQYEYLPDLNDEIKPENKKKKKKGRKKKVQHLFNIYRLHHARLLDLVKLVELRNYEVTGYRETICFLYRYWSCCFLDDPTEALNQTHTLNLQFSEPLPFQEVERATRSAEKAYKARSNDEANRTAKEKGYPGAGYNISNKKLIDWLDITEKEQRYLITIIGSHEKLRRKRLANAEMRLEQGIRTMEEYNEERRERKEDKLFLLKKVMKLYPEASNYKLADLLKVSESYIRKLKREIDAH